MASKQLLIVGMVLAAAFVCISAEMPEPVPRRLLDSASLKLYKAAKMAQGYSVGTGYYGYYGPPPTGGKYTIAATELPDLTLTPTFTPVAEPTDPVEPEEPVEPEATDAEVKSAAAAAAGTDSTATNPTTTTTTDVIQTIPKTTKTNGASSSAISALAAVMAGLVAALAL